MGYRSDVAYLIAGPRLQIQSFLVTTRLAHPTLAGALREVTVGMLINDETDPVAYIGFHAEQVKWCDHYPDVAWHEALWLLAEETGQFEGRFCRIGEDDDDTETREFGDDGRYDLWDFIEVQRSLSVNFGTDESDDVRAQWREDATWTMPIAALPAPPPKKQRRLKKPKRTRPNLRSTSWTIKPRKGRATGGASRTRMTNGGTMSTRTPSGSAR